MTLRARLEQALDALGRPVDLAWLAAFRFLFGLTMSVSALRFLAYGWVDDLFVRPTFHFKYWGFGWVEPLSSRGMHGVFWALAALSLAMALGLCFRAAALGFVALFTYVQLIDVATYLNHYYLAALLALLLLVSPAHHAFSLDAALGRVPRRDTAPAAWLHLFRLQVGVVYTFAGLAKASSDWLLHAQPLRIWLGSRSGLPMLGPLLSQTWSAPAMSWAGFLFDTSVPWLLLWSRTRPLAYVVVLIFHTMTRLLFPIGMFPVIMVLSALVFFPPSWPRGLVGRGLRAVPGRALRGRLEGLLEAPSGVGSRGGRLPAAALALGLVYAAVQVALPLRFVAYGGDVRWHEQGMRFSWRVMVREKNGTVTFVVRYKETGRTWHVPPRSRLTRLQEREMSGQPDLILQLAHRIRDDLERQGQGPVEVRVEALASLNGRRLAPLIDPDVDLTTVRDGIAPARWILPVPPDPPPHLRPL